MEGRLATGLWVSAYRKRLELAGIPAYVTARGDDTAGAVLVKLATMDGQAVLYQRSWDYETDGRHWTRLAEGPEPEVDDSARRQRGMDPDLWVIEIEDRQGRTLLEEDGLA
ncbi:DUF1491 family protein [Pseudoroseicyclus tamaricis]|uniref:DUF1491 family protein n=1 Tax=Pseudoroseicyclus tamaricis TaxID=2705421 RepID=A0A6B2JLA1_9RHOB|nr:DUF1491 family protein [Pseudoroseicyclus tamaricis]NDV02331.1 DUF1491 family protein [Pseudoroseicyclus tamaricis]